MHSRNEQIYTYVPYGTKSIPASLAFTETYRQHAPTSIALTLHVQPGVLTTLIVLTSSSDL